MNFDYATLLPRVIALAKEAGTVILSHYDKEGDISVKVKEDQSPVTAADVESDQLIRAGLSKLTPSWPIISEESPIPEFDQRKDWEYFWCVDPLDGTKGFIRKTDDFVVNIALVKDNLPVLGVVYSPTRKTVYYSNAYSRAYRQVEGEMPTEIKTRSYHPEHITMAVSRFHQSSKLKDLFNDFPQLEALERGSAIKSCYVAEGRVDIAPRLGPTCAWDTAAAQCIVEQAGGKIIDLEGKLLQYNTQESLLNPSFLVIGDPSYDWVTMFNKTVRR